MNTIFNSIEPKTVLNPVSQDIECVLMNTKKEEYYIHTYDARPIIRKLREELHVSDEVLSKFDLPEIPRTNCCNAISITLYFNKCDFGTMDKYLSSIYRTVKNVNKRLPDWLVRLYFDKTVYECIDKKEIIKEDSDIFKKFKEIIKSPNVEIYTYNCQNFYNDGKVTAKIRSLRFLTLIDPTVNICAIREADGYITNLECHNLNIFSRQNDRLFYLPWLTDHIDLFKLRGENVYYYPLFSYQAWLKTYKMTFAYDYFKENQNMYDLLAGMFTTKLKIKSEFYFQNSQFLHDKIEEISKMNLETFQQKYPKNLYINNMPIIIETLNNGFDEIFLLDIYKEIISVPVKYETFYIMFGSNPDPELTQFVNHRKDSLFYANNIYNIKYEAPFIPFKIMKDLKEKQIIPPTFDESKIDKSLIEHTNVDFEIYDAVILKDIIYNDMFNITFINNTEVSRMHGIYLSSVLNLPYIHHIDYSSPYDIKIKYLKYKQKYMNLKNKISKLSI
jgi:hypothetical protein